LKTLVMDRFMQQTDSYEPVPAPEIPEDIPVACHPQELNTTIMDKEPPEDDAEIGLYGQTTVSSPAYSWLQPVLQRETILARATPDLMKAIETKVLATLPPKACRATFKLKWDPIAFVEKERYAEPPEEAIERAITLTGRINDAQAVTTVEYLAQTWPISGKQVMQLVIDVVRNTITRRATCKSTAVSTWSGKLLILCSSPSRRNRTRCPNSGAPIDSHGRRYWGLPRRGWSTVCMARRRPSIIKIKDWDLHVLPVYRTLAEYYP
jgi:hypothetical protein